MRGIICSTIWRKSSSVPSPISLVVNAAVVWVTNSEQSPSDIFASRISPEIRSVRSTTCFRLLVVTWRSSGIYK